MITIDCAPSPPSLLMKIPSYPCCVSSPSSTPFSCPAANSSWPELQTSYCRFSSTYIFEKLTNRSLGKIVLVQDPHARFYFHPNHHPHFYLSSISSSPPPIHPLPNLSPAFSSQFHSFFLLQTPCSSSPPFPAFFIPPAYIPLPF